MPVTSYPVNQLVTDAYRLIRIVDENDVLAETQMQTGINDLNKILSVDEQNGLNVPYFTILSFNFVSGQAKYEFSLDETAIISTPPITLLENIQLLLQNNTRVPVYVLNRDQYKNVMRYQMASGQPTECLFSRAINKSFIEFWPTPNTNWTCEVSCKVSFTQVEKNSNLNQVPPYYLEYLEYALAFKLSNSYGDSLWSQNHQARLTELKEMLRRAADTDYSIQPSPALLATRIWPIANNVPFP